MAIIAKVNTMIISVMTFSRIKAQTACLSHSKYIQMDFMTHFTMGTGGHYITMLPADWLISTSHDTFALQFLW